MPSPDTFSIKPIGEFVHRYLKTAAVSVDPFARNKNWATYTNDLNPKTSAKFHMEADDFLNHLFKIGVKADLIILDPPYSARQVSEVYQELGVKVTMQHTQTGALYSRVRAAAAKIMARDCRVLSFGWNTVGMGKKHGMEIEEIMLCCHGGGAQ